jgi:hypothetical protein
VPKLHRVLWLRKRINAPPQLFSPIDRKPLRCKRHWKIAAEIRALEAILLKHVRARLDVLESRRYAD